MSTTSKQKKKLDSRIPALISNGVTNKHRSFFVIVGDRGRDQVVTLHYLLSKQRVQARPNVLWCYSKDLNFSSNRKKRMNQIKKEIARGTRDADEDDPFELFVSSTSIRYAYYKETEKILGSTYGMCILQDFEALTPNLLARTIETVEGGGIVVLLLKTMTSLKQLYTMTMDVHSRYRTEAHQDTVSRFNERFILSLGGCETCLVVDDELNVLPLSAGKNVKLQSVLAEIPLTKSNIELNELKESLKDTLPIGSLIKTCKTLDQAKAVLTFVDAIAEKTLKSTVTLTAARGRGKSAALGISIAAAVSYGYSNIFLTSPSPENLKTLFEFIFKAFDALGYEEHMDYDILQSTNPSYEKAVVRVNIFRDHRQTIQWILPTDYAFLTQAELLVIDEAAAIPLPVVKKLLGPYLVFMASTINGYEGTGRSLSMKLIKQLREQSVGKTTNDDDEVVVGRDGKEKSSASTLGAIVAARSLKEIKLEEPIRYGAGDSVESWLNKLLCLDCCTPTKASTLSGCPHPSKCELYYVTRDTLFSYHPVSEAFLQMMMSLYVASHYKNTPNDLQLLSDAPAHHLFVLLPPTDPDATTLPEPLVVLQICMEGQIARGSALASLSRGVRAAGDLIPWVISQQFQDDDFASLSGARIVRIATHPDYVAMGYGARAVQLLEDYYDGKIEDLDQEDHDINVVTEEEINDTSELKTEEIKIKDVSKMPPLLLRLGERRNREQLDWIGVSFGVTKQLHKFWKRAGYRAVYVRQTKNDLTGEYTCIMLKQTANVAVSSQKWLDSFRGDFRKRFMELLSFGFRGMSASLCVAILDVGTRVEGGDLFGQLTPFDLKRLESYSRNLLDYHVILDLMHTVCVLYFTNRLGDLKLSAVQSVIFIAIGLQKKTVEEIEVDLGITVSQILALFAKGVKKCSSFLNNVVESEVREQVDEQTKVVASLGRDVQDDHQWNPVDKSLDEDLEEGGDAVMKVFREKQRELVDSLNLESYSVGGAEEDWDKVKLKRGSGVVSIENAKSTRKRDFKREERKTKKKSKKS